MSASHLPTVLIVEDEALIALELEEIAKSAGWVPLAFARHQAALAALEERQVDFALIDGTPEGKAEFDFARKLVRRGIKFAFCTGAPGATFPDEFRRAPLIVKPYRQGDIEALLDAACPVQLEHISEQGIVPTPD